MTRKGLGLGAALSLVAASLVGAAPAHAATATLAPKLGTEYRVAISETFTLESRYDATANGFNDPFDVLVSDVNQDLASVSIGGSAASYDTDLDAWVGEKTSPVVGTKYDVILTPSTTDETFSVEVQTGFDLSATGEFGGTTSPVREVFFHIADDYTWNLDFTKPVLGDTELAAAVTTSPALNLALMATAVDVGFATVATNGTLTATGSPSVVSATVNRFTAGEDMTWSATDSELSATEGKTVVAGTYAAGVVLGGEQVSATVYQVAAAATIDALTNPELVAGANTNSSGHIRTEGSSFQVSVDATLSSVAADGETVTFTIGGNGSWDEGVVTVGSESYDADSTDALEIDVVTDADGTATLTVATAGFVEDETITVSASAQSASGGSVQTFTFKDTAAASLVDNNIVGTSGIMKVTAGSSYTLSYVALDNFGQVLEGDFYVRLSNGTTVKQDKVSAGVASFSLTDSATVTESYSASLWGVAANGVDFAQLLSGATVTTTPTVGASNAASEVTATATYGSAGTSAELLLADLENVDTRLGETAPSTSAAKTVTITGSVTDANDVVTYSMVTLSAPGVLFSTEAGTKDVYSIGSITVRTNAQGAYDVDAFSNTSGEVTVTVTAGSATEEVDITFDPAAPDTGVSLVIDAPVAVAPGSTVIVTATLTDEYGNGVETDNTVSFAVDYDGPGLEVVTPTDFDENGEAKLAYFLGSNDSGTITVTYSYSGTGSSSDFDGDDDLVVQKTIYIGSAPSEALASWTSNQNDGTVKMYAKNIVGAGKVQFMVNGKEIAWVRAATTADPKLRLAGAEGAAYLVRTVDLVEGQKNVLEIYVDGVRTTRSAYTY